MVIFDCNGVLVDSEPIAAAVLSEALGRIGIKLSATGVMRRFHGRRPADVFAAIQSATGKTLPPDFVAFVAAQTLRRLRSELRPIAHAAHALTWIRGPKAVASSSPPERIRTSLEVTGLMRFFDPRCFSASAVRKGKPAPDLLLLAAARCEVEPSACIVVEEFGARHCRGGGRGHETDRLCRRQSRAGQTRCRVARHRSPHHCRRHARVKERDRRSAGVVIVTVSARAGMTSVSSGRCIRVGLRLGLWLRSRRRPRLRPLFFLGTDWIEADINEVIVELGR